MRSAVDIGFKFEEDVVKMLQTFGLKACRTNKTNIHDPEGYKHGFDGGVDIIATFHTSVKRDRDFVFFIQCKNQKHPLEKSAIAEVFTGMFVRKGSGDSCIPVVFATCEASPDTRRYAKEAGVELFLKEEFYMVNAASPDYKVSYKDYGVLTKVLLYLRTKDTVWLDTLPSNGIAIPSITAEKQLLAEIEADYDKAQSYLDYADSLERKVREERQKAFDIQRIAAYKAVRASGLAKTNKEHHTEKEKPAVVEDPG
ncbi:MAG: restriction endonuclease [Clostridium sp.]|nr:restriction endonuclease [Clostridium sp.]